MRIYVGTFIKSPSSLSPSFFVQKSQYKLKPSQTSQQAKHQQEKEGRIRENEQSTPALSSQPCRSLPCIPIPAPDPLYACVVVAGGAVRSSDRAKINTSLLSHRRALPRPCGWVGVVPMVVEAASANSAFAHVREVEGQRHAWRLGRRLLVVVVCARICFALNGADSFGARQDRWSCGESHMKAHQWSCAGDE